MAFATVPEIRAVIYTSTLTDEDLQGIITVVSAEILARVEASDDSNELLKIAGRNAIYAAVKRRMKDTGELAASIKQGSGEQQNTTDQDIRYYEDKVSLYLRKYLFSSGARLYGRAGTGTVNARI